MSPEGKLLERILAMLALGKGQIVAEAELNTGHLEYEPLGSRRFSPLNQQESLVV